jgi:transcriptional regulator with XRE-family HTH domain
MLTIEEIREKLQDRNLTKVAASIGITRVYLSAIANGKQLNPSYDIVKKLSDYLEA